MFGQPIFQDQSEGSYPLYASLLRTSALEKSYFRISSFSIFFAWYGDISHGFDEVRDIFTLIYACVCRVERRVWIVNVVDTAKAQMYLWKMNQTRKSVKTDKIREKIENLSWSGRFDYLEANIGVTFQVFR